MRVANNQQADAYAVSRQNSSAQQNNELKTKGVTEVGKNNQMLNKESISESTGKGYKINIKA